MFSYEIALYINLKALFLTTSHSLKPNSSNSYTSYPPYSSISCSIPIEYGTKSIPPAINSCQKFSSASSFIKSLVTGSILKQLFSKYFFTFIS